MKTLNLFIFIILCLTTSNLCAQTKGTVLDGKADFPLEGVNIYLCKDSTGIGITDRNGNFEIAGLKKLGMSDTIVFSYVGYNKVKCTIQKLRQDNCMIYLYELPQSLSEITVTARERPNFVEYISMPPLPSALYSYGSFLSEGKIYVVAGDETLVKVAKGGKGIEAWEYRSPNMYIYDIATDSWALHKQKFASRAGHVASLYNDRAFVLGGKRFSTNRKLDYTDATMEVYDFARDTLYVDPVNPHQAVNFTSTIYENYLYVIGGSAKEKVYSDKIHALDLKTGCWYEMGTIPEEQRREMNGILMGHTVYFFGGHRFAAPLWRIDSYDLLTGEWKQLRDLKNGVSYPALASQGNLVYIYENKSLQVYNVATGTLAAYPINLELENAGMFYWKGKLYLVGGCVRNGICVSPTRGVYCIDVTNISTN